MIPWTYQKLNLLLIFTFYIISQGFTLTLQVTGSIHDSMNIPKIEFITYIYILYNQSTINFQFSPDLAGFPDILN